MKNKTERLDNGEFESTSNQIVAAFPEPGRKNSFMVFTTKGIYRVESKPKKKKVKKKVKK